jgi:hypothetical protein
MGHQCTWDGRYDTEEQEYKGHQVHFDVDLEEKTINKGEENMKKWLLQTKLLSGKGLKQVKVRELMKGDFNEENIDELNVAVSTLIEAGETKEYTDNVYLKLGVFEGENKDDAFGAYADAFSGDDQNELFFMNQIEALELASSGCNCGGKCSSNGGDMNNEFRFVANDETIAEAIDSGELFIQEKITAWNETRVKLKETDTLESVKAQLLEGGYSSEWEVKSREMIPESEEFMEGEGTFVVTNRNNVKLGGN